MKKRTFTRWLASAAVLLGMGVAVPVATAAPASAGAYGCNGTLIHQLNHTSQKSGEVVATTYLYWDGTYNCVVAVKRGSFYGKNSRMELYMMAEKGGQNKDEGYFSYYAGPARVNGVNSCVAYELDMYESGYGDIVQDRIPVAGGFHCS
jgi:hypothetical protein